MTTKPLVLFAHGKESGPWGTKIQHLARIAEHHGCAVLSPEYGDLPDADERVKRLLATELPAHGQLIMVGSSMGGYISTVASTTLKPAGLFLMAPAFYYPGSAEQNPVSGAGHTCVVFGWHDEIIPVEHGIRFAKTMSAELHVFDGDHRLIGVLPEIGEIFDRFLTRILTANAPEC
ncbi:alpha/beta hydrolase [Propionivibrio limicola]|uniref:alpha/beta hydrolase n=1 Tax=Propionivibrio limicola TaxID=167645 RepID=UPI0012923DD6|nr:alpha/beta hydrolase [Propionivibrio limicola]